MDSEHSHDVSGQPTVEEFATVMDTTMKKLKTHFDTCSSDILQKSIIHLFLFDSKAVKCSIE